MLSGFQQNRSFIFQIIFLLIACFACIFSTIPSQIFYGIIFSCSGLLLIILPPKNKQHIISFPFIIFFIALLLLQFLPRNFAQNQDWRIPLEQLGISKFLTITPNPVISAEHTVVTLIEKLSL